MAAREFLFSLFLDILSCTMSLFSLSSSSPGSVVELFGFPSKFLGIPSINLRLDSVSFYKSRLPAIKLGKHGATSLGIPNHDPPLNITVFLDDFKNPRRDVGLRPVFSRNEFARNLNHHLA